MRLTLKWKLYRFANYFLFLSFALLSGIFVFAAIKNGVRKSDLPTFIPAVAGMSLMVFTSFFNLYIFYKYFPDKPLSGVSNKLHTLFIILFFIALLGLLIMCIWGIVEEMKNKEDDNSGIIILSALIIILLTGFYILSMQLFVRKYLRKNYTNRINHLIENIGNEKE